MAASPDAEDSSQWTRVKRKPRRKTARRPPAPTHAQDGERPAPVNNEPRPVAYIEAEVQAARRRWEESPCCEKLRGIVASRAAGARLESVSRAVCLGVGTFDPVNESWDARRRTVVQFVAFLLMVEAIEKTSGTRIECIFQDPIFSESDISFIRAQGHAVVDSPAAFAMIDASTLLYGVHLYWPVYSQALSGTLPAVFVGTGWDTWHDLDISSTKQLDKMEEMHRLYQRDAFPQDADTTAFSSTVVYWRPATEPDADDT